MCFKINRVESLFLFSVSISLFSTLALWLALLFLQYTIFSWTLYRGQARARTHAHTFLVLMLNKIGHLYTELNG